MRIWNETNGETYLANTVQPAYTQESVITGITNRHSSQNTNLFGVDFVLGHTEISEFTAVTENSLDIYGGQSYFSSSDLRVSFTDQFPSFVGPAFSDYVQGESSGVNESSATYGFTDTVAANTVHLLKTYEATETASVETTLTDTLGDTYTDTTGTAIDTTSATEEIAIITGTTDSTGGITTTIVLSTDTFLTTTYIAPTYTTARDSGTTDTGVASGPFSMKIGTVYQVESPFEVIWAADTAMGADASSIFESAAASYTEFTFYRDGGGFTSHDLTFVLTHTTTFTTTFSTNSTGPTSTITNTSGQPTETLTLGCPQSTVTQWQYADAVAHITRTVRQQIFGPGDIPYSTTTESGQTYLSQVSVTDNATFLVGGTFTIEAIAAHTFISTDIFFFFTTVSCLRNNGLTTTIGAQLSETYSVFTSTGASNNDIIYLFSDTFTSSGITTRSADSFESFVAIDSGYSASGSGFSIRASTEPEGIYASFGGARLEEILADPAGIIPSSTDFEITNPVYINYSISGDFTYIYYPFKSSALVGDDEVAMTFTDLRGASYYDPTASQTVSFSYFWETDTTPKTWLNVTRETILTTTAGPVSSTYETTTFAGLTTGTVVIGAISVIPQSHIYFVPADFVDINSMPFRFGGYPANTDSVDTLALFPGIYNSTEYSYEINEEVISQDSDSGQQEIADIATYFNDASVLQVVDPKFMLIKTSAELIGDQQTVYTYDNEALSTSSLDTNYS